MVGAIHYFSNHHVKLHKRRINALRKYAAKRVVPGKEGREAEESVYCIAMSKLKQVMLSFPPRTCNIFVVMWKGLQQIGVGLSGKKNPNKAKPKAHTHHYHHHHQERCRLKSPIKWSPGFTSSSQLSQINIASTKLKNIHQNTRAENWPLSASVCNDRTFLQVCSHKYTWSKKYLPCLSWAQTPSSFC